jgi:ribosomal protein S18
MFKIIEKVATVFENKRTTELEEFITSRNPINNSDVDRLVQEYQDNYIWARGL